MNLVLLLRSALIRLKENQSGQDLIEYALIAAFVAVSVGATMPGAAVSISSVFSEISSVMPN